MNLEQFLVPSTLGFVYGFYSSVRRDIRGNTFSGYEKTFKRSALSAWLFATAFYFGLEGGENQGLDPTDLYTLMAWIIAIAAPRHI